MLGLNIVLSQEAAIQQDSRQGLKEDVAQCMCCRHLTGVKEYWPEVLRGISSLSGTFFGMKSISTSEHLLSSECREIALQLQQIGGRHRGEKLVSLSDYASEPIVRTDNGWDVENKLPKGS